MKTDNIGSPASIVALTNNHLLTKPAVPGIPTRLSPPIKKEALIQGIFFPRPLKFDKNELENKISRKL